MGDRSAKGSSSSRPSASLDLRGEVDGDTGADDSDAVADGVTALEDERERVEMDGRDEWPAGLRRNVGMRAASGQAGGGWQ